MKPIPIPAFPLKGKELELRREVIMNATNVPNAPDTAGTASKAVRPNVVIADAGIYRAKKRMALLTIWIPTLGASAAVALAFRNGIGVLELGLLVGMYTLTMMGVEVSFHRQLSHNAFDSPKWVRVLLAIFGSMAAQGGVLYWVATHRRHHIHSDTPDDPHSPYYRMEADGPQKLGRIRGLWHAQLGNMYTDNATNVTLFAKDLLKDPVLIKVNQWYPLWVLIGLAIPTALGGVLGLSWEAAFNGFLWGGLVRIFLVHHVYFANGSFSHMYGARPFDNGDMSSNNLAFAVPTFGSAYQNNHHAFPTSALIGFQWWQIDVGHMFVRAFELLGLAHNVKRATAQQIEIKLAQQAAMRTAVASGENGNRKGGELP